MHVIKYSATIMGEVKESTITDERKEPTIIINGIKKATAITN